MNENGLERKLLRANLVVLLSILVMALLLYLGLSCVTPEKVSISAEVEAVLIRMGDKTLSGRDTIVGGGGDSVTTWILALGIVSTIPLSALFYTKVVRAFRITREKKKKQCGDTRIDTDLLDG